MGPFDLHDIPNPWRTFAFIAIAFLVAWLISRASKRLAEWLVGRYQARHFDPENATSGVIMGLKRRATIVSLVQTTVRYAAYGLAILFAVAQSAGFGGTSAVAGASLFVLLVGFALQRFLIDILTGFFMQFEGWFAVGDSVIIEPWALAGVVEEISLRSTKLRSVTGEVIRVHNSNIYGARVLPRGTREVSIEIFVRDEAEGRRVLTDISQVMPAGPTQFIRRPWIESVNQLAGDLIHLRARATVAPGREWLAYEFLPDVLKERAPEGLIVHGPVIMAVDEIAGRRYAGAALPARVAP
jgi:moderate conductance mechanosensitive channel